MAGILIALLSGACMSLQGVFNTEVTKNSGVWAAASWVQLSALLTCLAVWGVRERGNLLEVFQVGHKYMLLGGVLGALITFTVIQSMGSLGPARAAMLIVISQLIVAYLIELFGWFGVEQAVFQWRRLIGLAVAVAGVILFKWE